MKVLKAIISLLLACLAFVILNTGYGSIPPLGRLLDPFQGFWQNAESKIVRDARLSLPGLRDKVKIHFDDHMVPHLFAKNDHDLYYAQGYVTAMQRLWQMDFQSRYAAGRLAEVVGEKALALDKHQRRMGMLYGAENMLKELEKHPGVKLAVEAYADGINAYINTLSYEDYPLEFKILNYQPEKWSILNTALLLKLMSATLAGGSDELYMTNALAKYGEDVITDLFPDYPLNEEPVIPTGTSWEFKPLPVPSAPELVEPQTAVLNIHTREKEEGIGSNNWALSGTKTLSGAPLLANDPHLDLTLPAIWHQVQLQAPGINTCGVSIPGAPGVIIGFNEQTAWGVTNVNADVLDWYKIRFKDNSLNAYYHNEEWKKVQRRIETIRVKGSPAVSDTVYYTHQGPVVYLDKPEDFGKARNVPEGYALRWIAHDPSSDVATFYYLNRAKNYDDYKRALSYYTAPAQNFVFASADNDIAITANGYFPLKWQGQGKFLLDGSKTENDWHGRIPASHNPSVKNPLQQFVSSANQASTDKTYPYYINWEFSGYERAHRINKRLAAMTKTTVDSMRILQNDTYSVLAADVLPTLLSLVDKGQLTASEKEALWRLGRWNWRYDANSIAASIFEIWQKRIYSLIWSDDFDGSMPMRYPSRSRTVKLLIQEPSSPWFDDTRTQEQESRPDIVLKAFKFTIDSLQRRFGPIGADWQWANVKRSNVPHLGRIPGLGSAVLRTGGSKTSVNAMAESNGPSWRMVVSLEDKPKAYGAFPGGQSGNPGSFYYDDQIGIWEKGELKELLFLKPQDQDHPRIRKHLTLSPK